MCEARFSCVFDHGMGECWDDNRDKENKQRLKAMAKCPAPIACSTFNHDGTYVAFSTQSKPPPLSFYTRNFFIFLEIIMP